MKTQYMYKITGKTNSGSYVTVSMWNSVESCMEAFINKYPRFNGNAELRKFMATSHDGTIWTTTLHMDSELIMPITTSQAIRTLLKWKAVNV